MSSANLRFLAIMGLTALILAGVLGMGMENMDMSKDGEMSGCIFTGKTMLCKMSVVEHISLWLSMFTATPTKIIIFNLLFLSAAFAVIFFAWRKTFLNPRLPEHFSLRQRQRYQPDDIFFNPLRYALAHGILNPKIYEPAVI